MTRKLALLFIAATLPFAACDKIPGLKKKEPKVEAATPAPVEVAATAPAPEPETPPEPPKPAIDTKAEVVVLCYHRFEGKAGGALSIEPALLEQHMQKIKESGVAVISMQDFLAWRRGEKSIPPKSVLITVDDGYVSSYDVGWPIFKKYGFPFTMFVYLNYINTGGKAITWAQLAEMRDAGVEIGSHTVSHQDLRRKPSKAAGDYDTWLRDEVDRSKQVIEEKLGIKCATIAYPFGLHNEKVHEAVKAAGYEAAFTTYGARLGMSTSAPTLGRYDVTAKMPGTQDAFTVAISFHGMAAPSGSAVMAQDAAVSMVTEPLNQEVITNPTPTLKANLATMGALEAGSVVMRVSGLGVVPAKFDAASKNITYTIPDPLRPGTYTVLIGAKAGGRPVETRWTFTFSPDGSAPAAAPESAPLPPKKKK